MQRHQWLSVLVVVFALAVVTMPLGAAGQGTPGNGCTAMTARCACGAATGLMAPAATFRAEKALDRGTAALITRTCPQSGKTTLVLTVRSTSGHPDPGARLTALVDRKSVSLVQAQPGVYRTQMALSRGTHQLVVHVDQGVSQSSVAFPLAVSAAPAVAPGAKEACQCGETCRCGADCQCGTDACQCRERCPCGADGKCAGCPCAGAAGACGDKCACGPDCPCPDGQCACGAGGPCQGCGHSRQGANSGSASPPAACGGCAAGGQRGGCPR